MKTTFTRSHFEHRPLAELSTGLLHRGMMLIIMLLSVVSLQAKVGDTFKQMDLVFKILTEDGGKGTVSLQYLRYDTITSRVFNIPESVTNGSVVYSVTSIANEAFDQKHIVGTLVIPNSVTSIGESAFHYCRGLSHIIIGNSVTSIGKSAFEECSGLSDTLVIPNSVTSIGDRAFARCRFNGGLVIPNSVTSIGEEAFSYAGFNGSLVIPNSVTSIGAGAFEYCGFKGSLTLSNAVSSIKNHTFDHCSFTGSLVIPNSVTSIGDGAFESCCFTGGLVIPNSVTSIGDEAFEFCTGFTGSLVIPNSVTSIGAGAFGYCTGFTGSLVIPNSVTSIGREAFDHCSFTGSLVIPNSVTSIGDGAFEYCTGFTGSLVIPNSVTSIGERAFKYCKFTDVRIPNSVTSIEEAAFEYDELSHLCLPSLATSLEDPHIESIPWAITYKYMHDEELTIPYISCNSDLSRFSCYKSLFFMGTDLSTSGNFMKSTEIGHTYVKPSVYEKYKDDATYKSLNLSDSIPVTFPANKKYVTMCRDFDVDLRHVNDNLPEGVEPLKAYIVDDADGDLKMVFMDEIKYIPSRLKANVEGYKGMDEYVGVVLKGTPGYTYYYQMGEDDYSKGAAGQMTLEKARALSGSSAKAMRAKRANSTSKASAYLVGAAQATEVKAEETVDGVTYKTYGLKNGSFLEYESDGIIPYNKAYLRIPIAKTPVEAKAAVTMYFNNDDGTTDIEKIDLDNKDSVLGQTAKDAMYNVNGVKVDNNYHGLVIVNGHKYMKK